MPIIVKGTNAAYLSFSLSLSLQNCISWISQFKDQIYLIIYTTFTNLKNIFFSIMSTPHCKKGHELKQAFIRSNHGLSGAYIFQCHNVVLRINNCLMICLFRSILKSNIVSSIPFEIPCNFIYTIWLSEDQLKGLIFDRRN